MVRSHDKSTATAMPIRAFKRSALAMCILAATSQAYAQEGEESNVEEVVVTGVKASLENAQNIKREADTFVDAISASDINALPDKSVLEAMGRLPGVSIERYAGSDDADHFSVEGSGVVIRGLSNTRSEFNGRDTFTANSNRGLNFEDVSPELMKTVSLSKNQSADMIEGGISGTVNLITRVPFDSDGMVATATVKGHYGDLLGEYTPGASGLFSNRWDVGNGEIGFLASVAGTNLKFRSDGVQLYNYFERNDELGTGVNGYDHAANGSVFVPNAASIRRQDHDRDRVGAAVAVQWQNNDESMIATLQLMHSGASQAWTERAIDSPDEPDERVANANTYPQPARGTDWEFDKNGFFKRGIISDSNGGFGMEGTQDPEREGGERYLTYTRAHDSDTYINDIGVKLEFFPNDKFEFSTDLQYIKAETKNDDISAHGAIFTDVELIMNGRDIPTVRYLGNPKQIPLDTGSFPEDGQSPWDRAANLKGNPWTNSDLASTYLRSALDHVERSEGEEIAFRLDGEYFLDGDLFESVQVGVRHANREQIVRRSKYSWGHISDSWSDGGKSLFTELYAADPSLIELYKYEDFQRNEGVSPRTSQFLFPSLDLVQDYRSMQSRLEPFINDNDQRWYELRLRQNDEDGILTEGGDGSSFFLPTEINETEEVSNAAYVRLNFGSDNFSMRFDGNIGFRVISYETSSKGGIQFPSENAPEMLPADIADYEPVDFIFANQPSEFAFTNGANVLSTVTEDFTKVLPSFNVKFEVTPDLISRFAVSKAISLPDLGNLRNHVEISQDRDLIRDDEGVIINAVVPRVGGYEAKAGNPFLKPMEAINWDLSLEYYFDDVGSLTFSLFYKEIDNWIRSGTSTRSLTNNGETRTVIISGPTNDPDTGIIDGFEINYQDFFDFLPAPWDGFGVQANYTYVNEKGAKNSGLRVGDPEEPINEESDVLGTFNNLPLQGLSTDTYNIVLMYQNDYLEGRLAYNYRSGYLLNTRDVIAMQPTYSQGTGTLDGSMSYKVNDQFEIGIEAANLLDEVNRLELLMDEGRRSPRQWFKNDRRFSAYVRWTL